MSEKKKKYRKGIKVSSAGSENYIIFHNNDGWNCEVGIFFFHQLLLRSPNAHEIIAYKQGWKNLS